MTWISLICLFALASSAFGRSAYSYGSGVPATQFEGVGTMRDLPTQQLPSMNSFSSVTPVQSGYGASSFVAQQELPEKTSSSSYGSWNTQQVPAAFSQPKMVQSEQRLIASQPLVRGYGAMENRQFDQQPQKVKEEVILTPADILCRGQRPETVIPIEESRRFVICLDESKGVVQACPIGLLYHTESRRCERKLGPIENPCASQPCLNGGQCSVVEHSQFQCQCAPGFDGKVCELDARVCQTQQPCGQSPDTRCQSFRLGAALTHICILQGGSAYGLDSRQVTPSPCRGVDGPQPLAISDKGFIMCDGAYMFVESCPGGTIWDDLNKACVWPDMQGATSATEQVSRQSGYGASLPVQQLEQPRLNAYSQVPMQSYGTKLQQLEQQKPTLSYGAPQLEQQRSFIQSQPQSFSQISQLDQTRPVQSFNQISQLDQTRPVQSFNQFSQLDQTRPIQSFNQVPSQSYGASLPQLDSIPQTSSYGSQQQLPKPQIWQSQSAARQSDSFSAPKPTGY